MLGRDIIQRLLALLDQWRRCSEDLEGFQSRLTISADTHVLLWGNNITSGQYDTVFYNDPIRRTTSLYSVARKNLK